MPPAAWKNCWHTTSSLLHSPCAHCRKATTCAWCTRCAPSCTFCLAVGPPSPPNTSPPSSARACGSGPGTRAARATATGEGTTRGGVTVAAAERGAQGSKCRWGVMRLGLRGPIGRRGAVRRATARRRWCGSTASCCCSSVDASAGRQSSGCLDSWLLLGSSLHGSRSRYRSRVELRLSTVRRIINVDGWTADPRSFCIPAVAPHPLPHIAWWVKAPSNCLPHTRLSAENVGSLVFRLGVQGSYPTSCYVRLPAN